MSGAASARLIGVFVLGAVALGVVLLLLLGRGNYFSHSKPYVAYFQGSLNGLNVGAQVKLKGVTIGRVTDIQVQYDMQRNRVLTPVIAEIDLDKVSDIREDHKPSHAPTLAELIARGLRARLSQNSLVTGQLYMDMNFYEDRPVELIGSKDLGLPEIPTIPSGREEIEDTLRESLAEFRSLPLKETFAAILGSVRRIESLLALPETQASIGSLNRSLDQLQRLIGHVDAKVDGLAGSLDGALRDSRTLVRNLNDRVAPLSGSAEQSLAALTATLVRAQGALTAVEDLAGQRSALNDALREVAEAARSVRALADSLERHPEALVYGRKRTGKPD
jgi:paraquat-inducible protein B